MKMMNNIVLMTLITLIFTQCKNDESDNDFEITRTYQDYVVAGDTIKVTQFVLDEFIEFTFDGDTVPNWSAGSNNSFFHTPLDIDNDKEVDIRFGANDFLTYNKLIYRALFVANNYGNLQNYEFAILAHDTIGMKNDTLKITKLFEQNDTISSKDRWYSTNDPDNLRNHFNISYYYDYKYHISTVASDILAPISGTELYVNKSGFNKYIGIRKKVNNDYIYGYINIYFDNYDNLRIVKSGFANK